MGKYLYQISDAGQIFCRFANDAGQEDGLRMDGFKAISEFTLEEKVNAAFMAASAIEERLDSEIRTIDRTISALERDLDDLTDDVEMIDRRMV